MAKEETTPINIRAPESIASELHKRAERETRTLTQQVLHMLKQQMDQETRGAELGDRIDHIERQLQYIMGRLDQRETVQKEEMEAGESTA